MRILFANNYHYLRGGSEKVMFDEVAALVEHGHEVATFSAPHPGDLPSPRLFLAPPIDDLNGLSMVGKIARFPRIVANQEVRSAFDDALDAFRPDVVHFHNIYGRLTPVVVEAARDRGLPSVLTTHDYKLICPSYLRLDQGKPCSACSYGHYAPALVRACHKGSRLYSILYGVESSINVWKRRYDGIRTFICPSMFMMDSLASKGIARSRLRCLPNCAPVPAVTDHRDGEYLLYAGRLAPEKGVRTLLKAMEGVDIPLLIAGNGPDLPTLERLAMERNLASRVTFLGHCAQEQLARVIAGALFIVVPSESFENAPMAVLEAFALGKPVVGSDIGGIPEMITSGKTGLLFQPGNPDQLRDAIRHMLASPSNVAVMGDAARVVARTRFSSDAHVRGLLDIYEEAVA